MYYVPCLQIDWFPVSLIKAFSLFCLPNMCDLAWNSDEAYIAYHDEEWGVPVHDDKYVLSQLLSAK